MYRDYDDILKHVKGVLDGETDLIANLANVCAILKALPGFFWVGFYIVRHDNLVLGPFQGPVACTRIGLGKGVCGTCWLEKKSILVNDVEQFQGHIACNPNSKSELVVPVFDNIGNVAFILDIDSDSVHAFDENDRRALENIASFITETLTVTA